MTQMVLLSLFLFSACSSIRPLSHEKQNEKLRVTKKASATLGQGLQVAEEGQALSKAKRLVKEAKIAHASDEEDKNAFQVRGTATIGQKEKASGQAYFLWGAEHLNLENYYFDIPVKYNQSVKRWIDYFLSRGKKYFENYVERSGRYAPVMGRILEEHGLPRDLIFLAMAESGFQNKAKSWAKAVGPWQFMPFTARRYGLEVSWYVDERRDPIKATIAAAKYLKDLYNLFGSWELAAAGYNAGEGKVSRAIKRYKTENFWKIRRGRYLKRETRNYVPKIMALAILGKNLKSFGMGDIDFKEPLDFDEIELAGGVDLFKVSKFTEVSFDEIHRLNPEIMRWTTPPHWHTYRLRVPVGVRSQWESCCEGKDLVASDFQEYTLRGRSSVKSVARKFRLPKKVLAELNQVPAYKRLRRGTVVKLPFRKGQSRKAPMYADLYERSRRGRRVRRSYRTQLRRALKRGRKIASPSVYYTVKKGDTLWTVARRNGVSMDTLIRTNYHIVRRRMIRAGDRLAIR